MTQRAILCDPDCPVRIDVPKISAARNARGIGQRDRFFTLGPLHVAIKGGHGHDARSVRESSGKSICRGGPKSRRSPASRLKEGHAFKRAHPQSAGLVGVKVDNTGTRELRRRRGGQGREAVPVKSNQAVEGADPKEAIRRGGYAGDIIVRKSLRGLLVSCLELIVESGPCGLVLRHGCNAVPQCPYHCAGTFPDRLPGPQGPCDHAFFTPSHWLRSSDGSGTRLPRSRV